MSTFGCEQKTVKTKKQHVCLFCNRTIPKGFMALHQTGMWEGDWQNWYACEFCRDKVLPRVDYKEEVSTEDFNYFVFDLDESTCKKCNSRRFGSVHFDLPGDSDVIQFSCNDCGNRWTHEIYGVTNKGKVN